MNTKLQITKALIIGLLVSIKATAQGQRQLTESEKVKIAWALEVLTKRKVLQMQQSPDRCIELDQDLIKQLESEGLIEEGTVSPQTVCFGGTI